MDSEPRTRQEFLFIRVRVGQQKIYGVKCNWKCAPAFAAAAGRGVPARLSITAAFRGLGAPGHIPAVLSGHSGVLIEPRTVAISTKPAAVAALAGSDSRG